MVCDPFLPPALHCGAKRRPWKAAVCRLFMTLLKKLQCMHVLCVSLCLMFSYVVLNKTLAFPSWIFLRYYITEIRYNLKQAMLARYRGHMHTPRFFCFRSPMASAHAKQCWCSVKVGPNSLLVEIWSRTYIFDIVRNIIYIYIDLIYIIYIIYSI